MKSKLLEDVVDKKIPEDDDVEMPEEILARPVSFIKVTEAAREESNSVWESILIGICHCLLIIPIFWPFVFRTVMDYQRALIFRLGKLVDGPARGPGLFFINPLTDVLRTVDLRIETVNLYPQDMMTKDSVTVRVDGIVYLKVVDPKKAILEVDNFRTASKLFAATSLRAVVGHYSLEVLLGKRETINAKLQSIIERETKLWGVTVTAVEVKDVILPEKMQRAMASEAEAERERRAKVISSVGETQAAENLARAAGIIAQSPGALQLRYLHTLKNISVEKNSTILFPLPMELMKGFMEKNRVGMPMDVRG